MDAPEEIKLQLRVKAYFDEPSLAETLAETLIEDPEAFEKDNDDDVWNIGDGQVRLETTYIDDTHADSWNYYELTVSADSKLATFGPDLIGERLVEKLGGDLELVDGPPDDSR